MTFAIKRIHNLPLHLSLVRKGNSYRSTVYTASHSTFPVGESRLCNEAGSEGRMRLIRLLSLSVQRFLVMGAKLPWKSGRQTKIFIQTLTF